MKKFYLVILLVLASNLWDYGQDTKKEVKMDDSYLQELEKYIMDFKLDPKKSSEKLIDFSVYPVGYSEFPNEVKVLTNHRVWSLYADGTVIFLRPNQSNDADKTKKTAEKQPVKSNAVYTGLTVKLNEKEVKSLLLNFFIGNAIHNIDPKELAIKCHFKLSDSASETLYYQVGKYANQLRYNTLAMDYAKKKLKGETLNEGVSINAENLTKLIKIRDYMLQFSHKSEKPWKSNILILTGGGQNEIESGLTSKCPKCQSNNNVIEHPYTTETIKKVFDRYPEEFELLGDLGQYPWYCKNCEYVFGPKRLALNAVDPAE